MMFLAILIELSRSSERICLKDAAIRKVNFMSDYKEKFDRWQKKATEKLEEIDSQLGLKEKIEGGARVVYDTAQKGAEYVKTEAEKTEVGKQAVKVAGDVINTATDTAKSAWNVSEPVRDVAADAGQKAGRQSCDVVDKAGDIFDDAVRNGRNEHKTRR